jgi:hypothetical protein
MKLFKLEITRFEPLTIIAKDFDDAQAVFIERMLNGFVHLPDINTAVSELRPEQHEQDASLLNLAACDQRGVASRSNAPGTWTIA